MDPEFLEDSEHEHDNTVVSVGILSKGSCDLDRLNMWIASLVRDRGADLFRYKGVLSVAGEAEKFVFQGVHMVFEGSPSVDWAEGEERVNKLIFIGRNLDKKALTDGFNSVLV